MKRKNIFPIIFSFAFIIALSSVSITHALVTEGDLKANVEIESISSSLEADVDLEASTFVDEDIKVEAKSETKKSVEEEDSEEVRDLEEINTSSENEVVVVYKRPAKLFGFIRTYVREEATIEVEADGRYTVEVEKSWWSIFAKSETKVREFKAAIQSRLSVSTKVSAGAELSASEKTRLVTEIQAAEEVIY